MLTRKPRVDEVLEYVGLAGEPVDVVVVRFWDRNPSIMVIRFPDDHPCRELLLWRFEEHRPNVWMILVQ